MTRAPVLTVALTGLAASCDHGPFVRLAVDADPRTISAVQLAVTLSKDPADPSPDSAMFLAPRQAGTPLAWPVTLSIELSERPALPLRLAVTAQSASGGSVAAAITPVVVGDAEVTDVALTLLALDCGEEGCPATCGDGRKDAGESDVDCGGPCAPCVAEKACLVPTDCASDDCTDGFCNRATGPPFWLEGAPLLTPRTVLGVTTATDGRIFAIGGAFGPQTGAVEAYDPALDAWETRAALVLARASLAAATAPDGRILAIGGSEPTSVEIYGPPPTDAWMWGPSTRSDRSSSAAAVFQDRVIVLGGLGQFTTTETFDGTMWVDGPALASNHSMFGATVGGDGLLYVVGGYSGSDTSAAIEAYDGSTWASGQPLPMPRQNHSLVTGADGRLYVIGGILAGSPFDTVLAYVPALRRWTPVASLGGTRTGLGATVGHDGRIYAVGGDSAELNGRRLEIYGPRITASPDRGAAGTAFTVTGTNFAALARVRVYLGPTSGSPAATVTTDDLGEAPPIELIAAGEPGPLIVTAVDDRSEYPVQLTFTID